MSGEVLKAFRKGKVCANLDLCFSCGGATLAVDVSDTPQLADGAHKISASLGKRNQAVYKRDRLSRLESAAHEVITICYMHVHTSKRLKICSFPQGVSFFLFRAQKIQISVNFLMIHFLKRIVRVYS